MKKTILILAAMTLLLGACKKDDVVEASKVEMKDENVERGWDYIKISGKYGYPVVLEAMTLYLSEKEDMSGAEAYSCVIEEKTFSVEADDLKDGTKYYYQYEYDNGYGKEKSEKGDAVTIGKPVVITKDAGGVTTVSAVLSGEVTNNDAANKIEERGFCWGTEPQPTIAGNHHNNGGNTGIGTSTFSHNISNLQNNATYYFRAYIKTNYGIIYGEEKCFKTVEITLPVVTTKNITNITETSARCGGNVTSDGNGTVTARGVCWSTSSNPTINDNKTSSGSGTGTFTSNLTNLAENKTYYVRAYATNEKGTAYGEEKSFKTLEKEPEEPTVQLPKVTTNDISNITTNSAFCGGNVTSDGNGTVTARGVCWSTSSNPTINDNKTSSSSGTGTFTSNLINLTENTTYYVRAYATNEKGTEYGEEKSFKTLEKEPEEPTVQLPKVTTNDISNITTNSAFCGGNVTSDGNGTVTARGVCWSTSSNPTINDNKTSSGSTTGTFTSNLTNLTENTTYYVRAYATNEAGTAYGEEKSFKTLEISMPTVTTNDISNITTNSAFCGGNVTSDGNGTVTARGVCWSTSPNPTINNLYDEKTEDGSGTGTFTSNLINLTENTTYYVRAYATNEKGTAYGEEKSFKTVEITMPTVTTNDISNITINSAVCGGNVTSDGNGTVTARGVCWSTNTNPTINNLYDEKIEDGNGIGTFTSNLTNLTENTTYYVRAYATNEAGTAYGEEKSFKTVEKFVNETINVNGVSFTMIAVDGGTFQMGAQSTNPDGTNYDSDAYSDEKPVHSVTLSDYYIGETEVTQELWEAVMGSNPSVFSGDQKPVEEVSWNDCKEFITKLNNLTGKNFRLPTEAEWEYAARGGNKSKGYKYSGSNTIGDVAWYGGNSGSTKTHKVKTKSPNELGIYDMSGNVLEWCEDRYGDYSSGSQTNPTGPSLGPSRVIRGGGWAFNAESCRVSDRDDSSPGSCSGNEGFRVVCLP